MKPRHVCRTNECDTYKTMKNFRYLQEKLVRSAQSKESDLNDIHGILFWLEQKKKEINVQINQTPLEDLKDWDYSLESGFLSHKSGKFFSIEGIKVQSNYGLKPYWEQPIINQSEIGFLGILTKEINGVLHFLMQAKIEPGNINLVQLSPTLQATRSNYTRTHKGKTPLYFEYFNGEIKNEILIDQLQSEQGARFLKKRNRNIIIEIDKNVEVELFDGYKWMTLGLINTLMNHDNLINMDTRTVISSVFQYLHTIGKVQIPEQKTNQSDKEKTLRDINKEESLFSTSEIISWITALKFHYELEIESKPIADLDSWVYDGNTIYHDEHKYFSVIGIDVKIGNREVKSWDQPMIKPAQEGIIGFIIRKINGVYHFLVQAKVEAGNFDILELAPTVQCLTGNYRTGVNEYSVPFINDLLEANPNQIWHKSYQSEEGGRFYREHNLNLIVEVNDSFDIKVPSNYNWLTLSQLSDFMRFNNYLNIGARSLISLISV